MRWTSVLLSAAALITKATCQDEVETFNYCDELERCFNGFAVPDAGITFGIATPEDSPEGFDLILQVTGETATVGWAGLAWGGAMTYNPIALVWPNGEDVTISSRMAFGYFVPPLFEDTTYSVLPGTTVNETHFTVTALCRGCSAWEPLDSTPTVLNGDGENYFAFAYSGVGVDDPTNIDTTFGIHERVGHWIHNLDHAKSPDFETWAAEAGEAPAPPEESSGAPEEPPAETSAAETSEAPVETEAPTETAEPPAETTGEGDGELSGGTDAPTTLLTTTPTPPNPTTTAPGGEDEERPALPLPTECPGVPAAAYPLGTAPGWRAVKISGNVTMPRAVVEDTLGNLLVLEAGRGLSVQTLDAGDGCISSSRQLIEDPSLNHGLGLSPDGTHLYVSSMTTAWELSYDAAAQTVADKRVVVKGMYAGGHPTRSLVIPPATPNLLVMQLGSNSNFDMDSLDIKTARANVKVFDVEAAPEGGWDWVTEGWDLGYGLRNDVALAVDGNNMVWSAENSADDLTRSADGTTVDVHIDNPAEELNYLGDPSQPNTNWYGYPVCFTIGNSTPFADTTTFAVGDQFVLAPNDTHTDAFCASDSVGPRLSIQAHSAPIGAAFDAAFSNMYVTLHGSWNREPATGYKVIQIPFTQLEDGAYDPVAARDSSDGYTDVMWNENVDSCTGNTCLRPSGITWDRAGTRMFVASDSARAGELFLLYQEDQAQ